MSWLNWYPDSEQITEENGIGEVVIGYAGTIEEVKQYADETGLALAFPQWVRDRYVEPLESVDFSRN